MDSKRIDSACEDPKFLEEYMNAYSPVGEEGEGQRVWLDYVSRYASSVWVDPYGTAVAEYALAAADADLRVVIEAHCDEIAWMITRIEDEGYARVTRAGGSDNMIAASKTVVVHGKSGKVRAVFGSPAVHVRAEYTVMGPKQEELWLDFGVSSAAEVKALGVEVGNLVTFDDRYSRLGEYHVGRALDNKIGGYIIAQAMRVLHERGVELPFKLFVVNSVQEEVGLYGARLIAQRIRPDLAIVHDVCHNTNHPGMNKDKDGDIKGGAGFCLEHTAQNHRGVLSKIREVCDASGIPYQLTVGSYGNDTVSFFLENVPTAIIATPLKYMHTTVEAAHAGDVNGAVRAFVEFLSSVDRQWVKDVSSVRLVK